MLNIVAVRPIPRPSVTIATNASTRRREKTRTAWRSSSTIRRIWSGRVLTWRRERGILPHRERALDRPAARGQLQAVAARAGLRAERLAPAQAARSCAAAPQLPGQLL